MDEFEQELNAIVIRNAEMKDFDFDIMAKSK
jgi:hypothetical protein